MSVEKNKFLPLHDSTTSFSPGWNGRKWEAVLVRQQEKKKREECNTSSLWPPTLKLLTMMQYTVVGVDVEKLQHSLEVI